MSIPTEKDVVELSTDEDWIEDFEFYLTDETEPNVLSDATDIIGAISQRTKTGEVRHQVSLTTTGITLMENEAGAMNRVVIMVDRLILKSLPEGLYTFALRAVRPGDVDEGLIRGKRRIVHGATQ